MVRYPNSWEKNLHQLHVLALPEVVLSEGFWREFVCNLHCGGCCPHFSLDYLPLEFDILQTAYPNMVGQSMIVEGKTLITLPNEAQKDAYGFDRCQYLDHTNGSCGIHDWNPLSCQIPLISIYEVKGRGYITKRPFARGWNMTPLSGVRGDILCEMKAEFSPKQVRENDLVVLARMHEWAKYFEIETHLPEIIRTVREVMLTRNFVRYRFRRSQTPASTKTRSKR